MQGQGVAQGQGQELVQGLSGRHFVTSNNPGLCLAFANNEAEFPAYAQRKADKDSFAKRKAEQKWLVLWCCLVVASLAVTPPLCHIVCGVVTLPRRCLVSGHPTAFRVTYSGRPTAFRVTYSSHPTAFRVTYSGRPTARVMHSGRPTAYRKNTKNKDRYLTIFLKTNGK